MGRNPDQSQRRRIFDFIVDFKRKNDGISPSFREIRLATGAGQSTIFYHLHILEDQGLIALVSGSARNIKIIGGEWRLGDRVIYREVKNP